MNKKILLIVEGEKAEPKIFKKLLSEYTLDFEIYCFGTNIYSLYKIMKDNDFNVNIKDILIELQPEQRDILSNTFVYTYLIFDLDPHHTKKDDSRTIEEIVKDNIIKVKKMAEYFIDETDPTIGKLYINYPMMESYKDCDSTFDENYAFKTTKLSDIKGYKNIVSTRKMSNIRIDKYQKSDFSNLIAQNIYKLNYIFSKNWGKLKYESYLSLSEAKNLLNKQSEIINENQFVFVINTSLFIVVDYFGNKNSFYDNLFKKLTL